MTAFMVPCLPIQYHRLFYIGNYVCNNAKQDFISGILSAHSQVLDCPAAKMSSAIYWLDDKFYCHQGDFCSQNFPR